MGCIEDILRERNIQLAGIRSSAIRQSFRAMNQRYIIWFLFEINVLRFLLWMTIYLIIATNILHFAN